MLTTNQIMQTQWRLRRLSAAASLFQTLSPHPFPSNPSFSSKLRTHYSQCSSHKAWLAQVSDELAVTAASLALPPPPQGPIELQRSIPTILAAYSDQSFLEPASFLLTGVFALFLFRSLRRRAKRAKEMKFRASGVTKSPLDEAKGGLRTVSKLQVKSKSRHSPDEVFLGGIIAAACGLLLYKFTNSIGDTLNGQPLPNNYSVRQITITIRTIINGMCYLATFVFGFNSLGLFLYSGQLALDSFVAAPTRDRESSMNSSTSKLRDIDSNGAGSASEDQSSEKSQNEE